MFQLSVHYLFSLFFVKKVDYIFLFYLEINNIIIFGFVEWVTKRERESLDNNKNDCC